MRIQNIPKALEAYKGRNIFNQLSGPKKSAFEANWRGMKANYADTVDGALLEKQILFCAETREDLYTDNWTKTDYEKGSRPELETIVYALTENKESEFDKALALIRFCRDLYKKYHGRILFDGGTEEELLKKGEQLCESLARLTVALCEIIGIAGRIVTHCGGGHLACELYVDKKWGYFDSRAGVFFIKKDGAVASLAELLDDSTIIDNQPEWVKAEISARWTWEMRAKRCRELFFSDREVNTVKPYSLADREKYNYDWRTSDEEFDGGLWETSVKYGKAQADLFNLPYNARQPHFEFTIAQGQTISSPIAVFAIPKMAVPPQRVRFYLNGEQIWETPETISPNDIHIAYKGVYPLFGENGVFNPDDYADGEYTLYVEAIFAPSVNGTLKFKIKRSDKRD